MKHRLTRRSVLCSALALPAARRQLESAPPPAALRYRTLGNTGLKVTELGFGSEAVSDETVFERAIEFGINFFDTARPYQSGNSERILGAALQGRRDKVVLSTRSYAKDAGQVALDLETSLKELHTDHVEIWYLGQRDRPDSVTPAMIEAQIAAQKAGKIRFRGISTHRLGTMVDFIIEHKFDVVQIPYNFALGTRRDPFNMDANNLDAALTRLKAAGIGVVAMKVMAGGYHGEALKEKNADIHARQGARIAAIRWALRDDRVQTTSVRMTDLDQLEENLRAMTGAFSQHDAQLLAAYSDAIRPQYCRMCGACDGRCPQGVPVSDVVRSVMYADGYGEFDMGLAAFQRSAGTLRCGECANCAVTCPNGVAVRRQMRRAQRLFC